MLESSQDFTKLSEREKREGTDMLFSIFGLLLLLYPLANVPNLYKNKRQTGTYFSSNSRFFVIKDKHFGNGLNMKNKYAFGMNLLLAGLLIALGVLVG